MLNGWTERLAFIAPLAALLATSACCLQDISGYQRNDAGDAGSDGGGDAGSDAGDAGALDAGPDAGPDAGSDAGSDAGPDAGDAGHPIGAPDAGFGACGAGADLTNYSNSIPVPFTYMAASADMDGDGLLDLVIGDRTLVADPGSSRFHVALALRDGGLGAPQDYLLSYLSCLAVGDLNGDGHPDAVVADEVPRIWIYLNAGNGELNVGQTYTPSAIVIGIAIGDVDGDGLADIVVGEVNSSEIFYGAGGGQFTGPFALPQVVPDFNGGIAVGDLDGDGRAEIIGDDDSETHLIVLFSQGHGDFKVATYPTPALGQIQLVPGPSGAPDLVLGQGGSPDGRPFTEAGVVVMTNAGDGTFGAARSYTSPGGEVVTIGDFNGDCIPDIATTASLTTCEPGWPISILYGDGDGGYFRSEMIAAVDPAPWTLNVLGPVAHPNALATTDFCDAGVTIYGNSSWR